jgi:hypothetical protein
MSSNLNFLPACSSSPFSSITIGDGSSISISGTGDSYISHLHVQFLLRQILLAPSLIKNLISVRKFTIDNRVSLEFDPFGLSMKDLQTGKLLARYNSSGDLYPLYGAPTSTPQAMIASVELWHRRLRHPNKTTLSSLLQEFCIPSISSPHDSSVCNACQCGKHIRLPFNTSSTHSSFPFELLHCD